MLFSRWPALARPAAARGLAALSTIPSVCAVCRGWSNARICADCSRQFAWREPRCQRCAIEVPAGAAVCGECLRLPPAFDRCIAALRYDHPWDGLISSFKFHAALDLGPALADALNDAIDMAQAPACDWILPVPLSLERLRERGYNQSWELARRLARRQPGRADARLLLRLRNTQHQLILPPGRRAANVRGAFMVEPARAAQLRGANVAIVDDVITTGSTLHEIAGCLKQAGAASVQAWVVARTAKE